MFIEPDKMASADGSENESFDKSESIQDDDEEHHLRWDYTVDTSDATEQPMLLQSEVNDTVTEIDDVVITRLIRPGKPSVSQITDKTATVHWTYPITDAHFELRYKDISNNSELMLYKRGLSNTSVLVEGLKPSTKYVFQVKPNIDDAEGPVSDESEEILTSAPDIGLMKPGTPEMSDITDTTLHVAWTYPNSDDVTFQVRYKNITKGTKMAVYKDDVTRPELLVRDLEPCTEYTFQVRGSIDDDEGPLSDVSEVVTTSCAVVQKLAKPDKPSVSQITDTTAAVHWTYPITDAHFELRYKDISNNSELLLYKGGLSNTSVLVGGLKPSTKYVFQVKPNIDDEEGPVSDESEEILTCAPEIGLMKPSTPVVSTVTDTSIRIAWTYPNTDDVTFQVRYKNITKATKMAVYKDDVTRPELLVRDLEPFTEYTFQVRASKDDDEGPLSDVSEVVTTSCTVVQKLMKPGTPEMSDITDTTIHVAWTYPNSDDVTFQVRYKNITKGTKMAVYKDDVTRPELLVRDLEPCTEYTFQVRASKDDDEGPLSDVSEVVPTSCAVVQKLVKPDKPSVSQTTDTTAAVHWTYPITDAHFELRYKDISNNSELLLYKGGLSKTSALVEGLKPSTKYVFQVKPNIGDEEGPVSDESEETLTCASKIGSIEPDNITKSPINSSTVSVAYTRKGESSTDDHDERFYKPSKPSISNVEKNSVCVSWMYPKQAGITFNLEMRESTVKTRMKSVEDDIEGTRYTVTGLKSNTKYVFRVRALSAEDEGPPSDQSDEIETLPTEVNRLLTAATKIETPKGFPIKYKLQLKEIKESRNEKAKIRKLEFGTPTLHQKEKTIIILGSSGAGKSTTIENMINFITGVSWEDNVRFLIVDLEKDESNRGDNQAQAQTEWITQYKINPQKGFRIDFGLTIIDTPGFGDPRGLERDQEIVEQLRALFSSDEAYTVRLLDGVCFVVKGSETRLNAILKYVFESMFSIFGHDVKSNISTFCTFVDSEEPKARDAMNSSGLPFGNLVKLNNAALFADNSTLSNYSQVNQHFWKLGLRGFNLFFEQLQHATTISAKLTADVLEERKKIEITLDNMQKNVNEGLTQLQALKDEQKILEQFTTEIEANKDFKYEVEETHHIKRDLPKGIYVTNCTHCHFTCHENCAFPNDEDKKNCSAMGPGGYCTQCEDKCFWDKHANTPYIFTFEIKKEERTYQNKLNKYKKAEEESISHKELLERMKEEFDAVENKVGESLKIINECNNTLRRIALKQNPLSLVDHIELMIQCEEMTKGDGYLNRIKSLKHYKQRATIIEDAARLNAERQKIS